MKTKVAVAGLLFAASLIQAQTPLVAKLVEPVTPTTKTTPVKSVTTKVPVAKDTKTKVEVMGVIPGTTIARPNGTFLGLEVVAGNFKLTFYDKKKKPTAMDVTRARARWPNLRSPGDNRTVLNGSGNALVGAKPVLPTFTFNVYLTLLQGENDEAKAVETYMVGFRG
ncbi:MAG: hypothetical protein EXS42_03450 [Lacunisphaera sp.]|nr:hypothetical protein [Lacunisphaera sp.]